MTRFRPFATSLRCLLPLIVVWPALAAEPAPEGNPAAETSATADGAAVDHDALVAAAEAAERRFNQAARERDRDSFRDLLAKDSAFLAGELHSGRLAVMAIWQHLFDGKYDFRYDAEALETTVASSGEFAWSVGTARTSFQRPGLDTQEVTDGHYLHVWTPDEDGTWRLAYNASLVVHPSLGAARDPRSGLMTAWPELADQVGAEVSIRWQPEVTVRAESGELAFTFGGYEASFGSTAAEGEEPEEGGDSADEVIDGKGHFLAVWQKDDKGHWQLAAEGFTPPGIYGE